MARCRMTRATPGSLEFTNSRNAVHSGQYPVVWCPKYRRQVLARGVEKRLKKILKEVAPERQVGAVVEFSAARTKLSQFDHTTGT